VASSRCADIVASIVVLNDDGNKLLRENVSIALAEAIDDGRLQAFLFNVNSLSQFLIYTDIEK
jgi:hypothetical protein